MKRSIILNVLIGGLTLFLAAGCKNLQKGTTPIPGGSGSIKGSGPSEAIGTQPLNPDQNPNRTDIGTIRLPGTRDITDRPHDPERFKGNTVYFAYDSATLKSSERKKTASVNC